jgi:ABC-type glycerol-3-phosphate transport system permease component
MRLSRGDRVFMAFNYAFLLLVLLIVAYPLIYILSSSFSSPRAVVAGRVWLWPVEFSLKGYEAVFKNAQVWSGYWNSIIYTVVGTAINVIMTILAAWPLSRKDLYGRNWLMGLFTFTMLFGGGLIATYLVVQGLGMVDKRTAMVIPNALSIWNMIVCRTYFQTAIPDELVEAAELDGCSDIRTIWHVVLPLSTPILAVIGLFYAVAHWNSYFQALIYLSSADLYPLQIVLRNILVLHQFDATMIMDVEEIMMREGMKDLLQYSLIVVASAPVLALYPFAQKYFVRGIMIGSLKG